MTAYRRDADLFVFTGQSFLMAPPPSPAINYWLPLGYQGGETAPILLNAMFPVKRVSYLTNQLGTTYANRAYQADYIDSLASKVTGQKVLIDCGGTSDIAAAVSASDLLTTVEAFHTARQATYDLTIACTIPPTGIIIVTETARTTYNTNLNASTVPDAVADIAAIPEFADYHDTDYFLDQIHPTALGALLTAQVIKDTLADLGVI